MPTAIGNSGAAPNADARQAGWVSDKAKDISCSYSFEDGKAQGLKEGLGRWSEEESDELDDAMEVPLYG